MNGNLLEEIDRRIEADRDDLIRDVIRLVNIKSVRTEPRPGAPFGEGVKKILDEVAEMGLARGFSVTDYGVGVISVAESQGLPDLGIWAHADVVPEGEGWNFPPYDATVYGDCVIGRGAADNKGQLVSILHLLTMFRELGIKLKYLPALYVGSCEETGMLDLKGMEGNADARGFLNICTPPRLSLVPDSGFPVAYGGKGRVKITIRAKEPLHGLTLEAGRANAPGKAVAVLQRQDCPDIPGCTVQRGECVTLTAETEPVHSAHPSPDGNMITVLTTALLDNGLCAKEDAAMIDFLRRVSFCIDGAVFRIDEADPDMGKPVTSAVGLSMADGKPELTLNIRYPKLLTVEEIVRRMQAVCEENGFDVIRTEQGPGAYLLDKDWYVIRVLKEAAASVTGSDRGPYTLSGATYANLLPNGLAFGMDGNLPPEDFPKGRGGAHGKDECVSVSRLQRAMRIYARALLTLDTLEW